jgi:hypothetical protein
MAFARSKISKFSGRQALASPYIHDPPDHAGPSPQIRHVTEFILQSLSTKPETLVKTLKLETITGTKHVVHRENLKQFQ